MPQSAKPALPGLCHYQPTPQKSAPRSIGVDIVIYGGTSAGVAAAIQARRMGKSAVIVEFGKHLGGLTSGGLGATDIGNKAAIGGISRDFYRRLGAYYFGQSIPVPTRRANETPNLDEAWVFEPSVAEKVMQQMVADAGVEVFFDQHLVAVSKIGARIDEIEMEDGTRYRAKMFIDATYDGDLFAFAGVSYHVGRESNAVYDETLNGVFFGHPNHNFNRFVDPYRNPAKPDSGLLPSVFAGAPGRPGDGDHRVQAYNFRVCLSTDTANSAPFPKPAGYDPARYELLCRYIAAGVHDSLNLTVMMPRGKTDTNNFGGFSSDNIGMNYAWPDGLAPGEANPLGLSDQAGVRREPRLPSPEAIQNLYVRREELFQDHVNYHAGLYYFLANDPALPAGVRDDARRYGLPRDEFTATSHWPHQLYVREARRMIGALVMNEHHCVGRDVVADPISLAAYTMDSHNCNRVVMAGRTMNEGNVEVGSFPPYPISYRAILPRQAECENILVPTCLSASHIAFGSIRMEPVFMILGQSAATAAALAIDAACSVQSLSYSALRERLLADGQVLHWSQPASFESRRIIA